jgi:hypothetical protein
MGMIVLPNVTMEQLTKRRDQLRLITRMYDELDLLTPDQIDVAVSYGIDELPRIIAGIPFLDWSEVEEWPLTRPQKDQVIQFYNNEILVDSGFTLTRYDTSGRSGYRFELAINIPVVSR